VFHHLFSAGGVFFFSVFLIEGHGYERYLVIFMVFGICFYWQ